jgi:hypothetical protein
MKPQLLRIGKNINDLSKNNDRNEANLPASNKSEQLSFLITVNPLAKHKPQSQTISLPKLKAPQIADRQHATNPAFAAHILKNIEQTLTDWQQELQSLNREIQDIYLSGPIVDGWLECHPTEVEANFATPHKASEDRLMNYVEEFSSPKISCQSPRAGYRLCGLDPSGQLWYRNCPKEQIPQVSLAIARYQKLRQLLNRKKNLEILLKQLTETLAIVQGSLER